MKTEQAYSTDTTSCDRLPRKNDISNRIIFQVRIRLSCSNGRLRRAVALRSVRCDTAIASL